MSNGKFPAFSVLMTVYEKEEPSFLDQALKSIENQTVKPHEIVIVKDGPLPVDLDEVLQNHEKSFVHVYKVIGLPKNIGRGLASKRGIEEISTEWVARMDSDDISEPNRFELQLSALVNNPSITVIGGMVKEFFGNKDNIVGIKKMPLHNDEIVKYANYRNPINNPTVMFRKEALIRIGNYSSLNILEDYDLWIRFIASGYELMNLDSTLVRMRVSNGMYDRRGGIHFLCTYIKMKNRWRKMGVGSLKTNIISDLMMGMNTLIPGKFRKVIYQRVLHKF